jgi:TrmH family RNA methyltransferase
VKLRDLSRSAESRHEAGLLIAEGPRLAEEALRSPVAIREAVIASDALDTPRMAPVREGLRRARVVPWVTDPATLAWLAHTTTPQGIVLLVDLPEHDAITMIAAAAGPLRLLVACGVQDPGNAGALVRLAEAAGWSGMIAAGGADPFGPRAVRASAGSIFRLPVARLAAPDSLRPVIASLRERGCVLAGATPRGGRSVHEGMPAPPIALLMGGEGSGLPSDVERALDLRLTIPMASRVESLNVAAAAAVLLFAGSSADLTAPRGSAPPPDPKARGSRRPAAGPGRAS